MHSQGSPVIPSEKNEPELAWWIVMIRRMEGSWKEH